MKFIVFFVFISFDISCCEKFSSVTKSSFEGILRSGLEHNREVSIINYDSDEESGFVLLSKSAENHHSFKLTNMFTTDNKILELDTSAIISCNSVKSLVAFNKLVKLSNIFFHPFKFYVHFKSASMNELLALKRIDTMKKNMPMNKYDEYMTDILQFQYFIVEENDAIKLMTFVWFSDEKCNEAQLTQVNSFNKVTRMWENTIFSIDKFKDFRGCSVTLGAFWDYPSLSFSFADKEILYFGQNAKLMVELSKVLNFKLKINPYYRKYGENISVDYLVHLQSMNNFAAFRGNSFFTSPYAFLNDYVAVPVAEGLNGYEKLLLPFDFETWICILITFFAAFFIAFIIAFFPKNVRDFTFGENVSNPKMNILTIFFGISQLIMPSRNFSRFLNMSFILFCLIIRTAYQGKMFEFLQQNIMKPEIQSIEEMIEKNVTLYVEPRGIELLGFSDDLKRLNMKVTSQGGTMDYVPQLFDPSFKGTVHLRGRGLYFLTRASQGKILDRLLEQRLYLEVSGLVFPKNHKFFETFNKKVQQLFEAGIFNFYNQEATELLNKKRYEEYSEPGEVLTMKQLEAGFVIWLVSIGFAFIAFAFEWLITFRDYIVFKSVLECYMRGY